MLNNRSNVVLAQARVREALSYLEDVKTDTIYKDGPLDEAKHKLSVAEHLLEFFIDLETAPKIDYIKLEEECGDHNFSTHLGED